MGAGAWVGKTSRKMGAMLVLVTAGSLGANTAARAADVVHACVNPSGLTRVVAADAACRGSEVALQWPTVGRVQALEQQIGALQALLGTQVAQTAALQAALNEEKLTRANGDASLATALEEEQTARMNADAVLHSQVAGISLDGVVRNVEVVRVRDEPGEVALKSAVAQCPPGKHVLGGGVWVDAVNRPFIYEVAVITSAPVVSQGQSLSNAWIGAAEAVFRDFSRQDEWPQEDWGITVYAICAEVGE
jgi:hypothetical protein